MYSNHRNSNTRENRFRVTGIDRHSMTIIALATAAIVGITLLAAFKVSHKPVAPYVDEFCITCHFPEVPVIKSLNGYKKQRKTAKKHPATESASGLLRDMKSALETN